MAQKFLHVIKTQYMIYGVDRDADMTRMQREINKLSCQSLLLTAENTSLLMMRKVYSCCESHNVARQ